MRPGLRAQPGARGAGGRGDEQLLRLRRHQRGARCSSASRATLDGRARVKIVIASDHAGLAAASAELVRALLERGVARARGPGHRLARQSVDYPDFAAQVARAVARRASTDSGVLVCGTGIGMSIVANKYRGVRAALCTTEFEARMARAHNDANVLCLGAAGGGRRRRPGHRSRRSWPPPSRAAGTRSASRRSARPSPSGYEAPPNARLTCPRDSAMENDPHVWHEVDPRDCPGRSAQETRSARRRGWS